MVRVVIGEHGEEVGEAGSNWTVILLAHAAPGNRNEGDLANHSSAAAEAYHLEVAAGWSHADDHQIATRLGPPILVPGAKFLVVQETEDQVDIGVNIRILASVNAVENYDFFILPRAIILLGEAVMGILRPATVNS
jgi:hypothetical protein